MSFSLIKHGPFALQYMISQENVSDRKNLPLPKFLFFVSFRRLATLSTKEEFPLSIALTPLAKSAPVIKEATTSNGVKLIARDNGASVSSFVLVYSIVFYSPIIYDGNCQISNSLLTFRLILQMVSINFAILSGSRAESMTEKGAAHLLATAAFAGTGKRSGLKLMRDLENIGATVGSSVDREKITYKVTCLPEKAEEAIAAVSEAISSPPAAAYVVEEMKETAELALETHKSSAKSQVMELLYEAAYGENTPMGSPTYAPLTDLSISNVMSFRKSNFTANNLIVSATGISIDSLKTMAELYLHSVPQSNVTLPLPSSPYVGGDMKVRDTTVGSSHLAVAFPVPKGAGAEPYKVLHTLLASKIAAMPVPEDSLVAFYEEVSSGGMIGFYSKGTSAEATSYIEAGVAELKAVAASSNPDAAKVKAALESFISLESGSSGAAALLNSTVMGVSSVADARRVSSAAVSSAAKTALATIPSYAVFGITAGTPSYAAVAKMMK